MPQVSSDTLFCLLSTTAAREKTKIFSNGIQGQKTCSMMAFASRLFLMGVLSFFSLKGGVKRIESHHAWYMQSKGLFVKSLGPILGFEYRVSSSYLPTSISKTESAVWMTLWLCFVFFLLLVRHMDTVYLWFRNCTGESTPSSLLCGWLLNTNLNGNFCKFRENAQTNEQLPWHASKTKSLQIGQKLKIWVPTNSVLFLPIHNPTSSSFMASWWCMA